MYYSRETEIENERSQFEILKRIVTLHKPSIIRIGVMRPSMVPYPDENTAKNENSRITVEVYGRYLIFGHIGEEVLKWLEEFGYRKNPKTESSVNDNPLEYKEFYMKLVGKDNGTQNG